MLILRRNPPNIACWPGAGGWFIFACLSMFGQCTANAQAVSAPFAPSNQPVWATNSALKEIGTNAFEIGSVRIDTKERTIAFPSLVNLREGNIEYLIVTTTGKTHESLLRTEARPHHLQVALLLLGLKGADGRTLPEDPQKELPGDKVQIELNWTVGTKRHRTSAEDFVLNRKAGRKAPRGPWIFTGSRFRDDGFAAELDGSIVSLITDADALINNPRPGREDDDNWLVRANGLPPLNTPVGVVIRLVK